MTATSSRCQNASGLTPISSNPQPKCELQCPNRWLLHSRNEDDFSVVVSHVGMGRPRVTYKQAA